jgi:RimJ/RimL family protein N-acetyltransferase
MINAVKANHHSPPNLRIWLISERETEKAVGIQMLKWAKDKNDEAEIGIMLLPKANGKQYAFEGMGALVDVGFSFYQLQDIYANFQSSNLAVKKFVENLGFSVTMHESNAFDLGHCSLNVKRWDKKVVAHT